MKKKYKMTKKERLKAYKFMLKSIEDQDCNGFCPAFLRFKCDYYCDYKKFSTFEIEHLPELMEYKPESIKCKPGNTYWGFWFPTSEYGRQKRIEILKTVINQMENPDGKIRIGNRQRHKHDSDMFYRKPSNKTS